MEGISEGLQAERERKKERRMRNPSSVQPYSMMPGSLQLHSMQRSRNRLTRVGIENQGKVRRCSSVNCFDTSWSFHCLPEDKLSISLKPIAVRIANFIHGLRRDFQKRLLLLSPPKVA